jgi:photosystem II stability/assembly factor-like uncharacterized protein
MFIRQNSNIIYILVVLIIGMASCGKNDDSPNIALPVEQRLTSPTDTLPAGWSKIKLPTNQNIVDIFFVKDTGFCFEGNELFRSTNGGETWEKVLTASGNFKNIGMGSTKNAAIISEYNWFDKTSTIYITQNGGESFDIVNVEDFASDIYFINPDTAFLIGNKLWKTTNSGFSWKLIYDFGDLIGHYSTLQFFDDQNGYVRLKDGLRRTSNGGNSWEKINCVGAEPPDFYGSIFFLDKDHGFLTRSEQIGKYDSVTSAIKFYSQISVMNFHDIHFTSIDTGYITDGSILKTVDGGKTWNKIRMPIGALLIELHFTDSNHGWACGGNGTILRYVRP